MASSEMSPTTGSFLPCMEDLREHDKAKRAEKLQNIVRLRRGQTDPEPLQLFPDAPPTCSVKNTPLPGAQLSPRLAHPLPSTLFRGACQNCTPESAKMAESDLDLYVLQPVVNATKGFKDRKDVVPFGEASLVPELLPLLQPQTSEPWQTMDGDKMSELIKKWDTLARSGQVPSPESLLASSFPGGIFYHAGQVEALKKALVAGAPLLVVPYQPKQPWDFLLINTIFQQAGLPFFGNTHSSVDSGADDTAIHYNITKDRQETNANPSNDGETYETDPSMLDYITHMLTEQSSADCGDLLILPVSVTYDFPPPMMESQDQVGRGSVYVDLEQAFSLAEYCSKAKESDQHSLTSHVRRAGFLGKRLTGTSLVTFSLQYSALKDSEGWLTRSQLYKEFQDHKTGLVEKEWRLGFVGQDEEIMQYSLSVLKDCVEFEENRGYRLQQTTPGSLIHELIQPVISAYSRDAILSIVCQSTFPGDLKLFQGSHLKLPGVSKEFLQEQTRLLFHILSDDFPHERNCEPAFISEAVDDLILREVLLPVVRADRTNLNETRTRRLARGVDRDCGEYNTDAGRTVAQEQFVINLSDAKVVPQITFLSGLILSRLHAFSHVVRFLQRSEAVQEVLELHSCEEEYWLPLWSVSETFERIGEFKCSSHQKQHLAAPDTKVILLSALYHMERMGVVYIGTTVFVSFDWLLFEERLGLLIAMVQKFC